MNKYAAMAGYTSYYTTCYLGSICMLCTQKDKNKQNVILIMSTMFILFNVFLFNAIEKADAFDTHI